MVTFMVTLKIYINQREIRPRVKGEKKSIEFMVTFDSAFEIIAKNGKKKNINGDSHVRIKDNFLLYSLFENFSAALPAKQFHIVVLVHCNL